MSIFSKKFFFFLFSFFIIGLVFFKTNVWALSQYERESSLILNKADSFFRILEKRDYKSVWFLLTKESKSIVINDVCKAIKKTTKKCNLNLVKSNFKKGIGLAQDYWNSYLRYFNPDLVLRQSIWKIKYIHKSKAEISIKYKKAPNPVYLIMKRENGSWKVGLAESFFK